MNYNVVIFFAALVLPCASCSGKSSAKIQSQDACTEAIVNIENGLEVDSGLLDIDMFYCSDEDRILFDGYIDYIKPFKSYMMPELIIKTASFFLNKPYVASTLEFEPEGLVVNLREFDCSTFVETVLALSRVVKLYEQPTFENFCVQLQIIRYRRGTINNYTDRIHYFSDWIYENETRGFVKDVTKEIGGEAYKFKLNYMSSHPDSYKQMKSHPEYVEIMQKKESEISERMYSFIPKERIVSSGKEMRDGDIVCFVTDIEGLDISHVGFIHYNEGQLTFIHASTAAKKVIINPQSLSVYAGKNKRNTGVMIVRPYFPK